MFQGRSTAEGRGWLQISPWPRFALSNGAEHVPEPMAAWFPCSSHHPAYCCALSEACSSVHVCTPARAMTWMTRSKAMVAGCPAGLAGLYSGLVKVRITRTELTLFQSLPFTPAVFI